MNRMLPSSFLLDPELLGRWKIERGLQGTNKSKVFRASRSRMTSHKLGGLQSTYDESFNSNSWKTNRSSSFCLHKLPSFSNFLRNLSTTITLIIASAQLYTLKPNFKTLQLPLPLHLHEQCPVTTPRLPCSLPSILSRVLSTLFSARGLTRRKIRSVQALPKACQVPNATCACFSSHGTGN